MLYRHNDCMNNKHQNVLTPHGFLALVLYLVYCHNDCIHDINFVYYQKTYLNETICWWVIHGVVLYYNLFWENGMSPKRRVIKSHPINNKPEMKVLILSINENLDILVKFLEKITTFVIHFFKDYACLLSYISILLYL